MSPGGGGFLFVHENSLANLSCLSMKIPWQTSKKSVLTCLNNRDYCEALLSGLFR